jgi:hypothetical protein
MLAMEPPREWCRPLSYPAAVIRSKPPMRRVGGAACRSGRRQVRWMRPTGCVAYRLPPAACRLPPALVSQLAKAASLRSRSAALSSR